MVKQEVNAHVNISLRILRSVLAPRRLKMLKVKIRKKKSKSKLTNIKLTYSSMGIMNSKIVLKEFRLKA